MLKKLTENKWRYISSIGLLLIALPLAAVTSYAGEGGRITGLIFVMLICLIGLHEIYRGMKMQKILAAILPLIIIPFFLLNYDDFTALLTQPEASNHLRIQWALQDWKIYLILFAGGLLPLAIDQNYRRASKSIVIDQLLLWLTTIIIAMFGKILWTILGKDFLIFLLFLGIAIVSDVGGYLGGRKFGTTWFKGAKLAPRVSPKKTWAGFVVGLVAAVIWSVAIGYATRAWAEFEATEWVAIVIGGIALSIVSPYGDLGFSVVKRWHGIKDFSNIIPGHGGIFDRIDALSVIVVVGGIFYLFAT